MLEISALLAYQIKLSWRGRRLTGLKDRPPRPASREAPLTGALEHTWASEFMLRSVRGGLMGGGTYHWPPSAIERNWEIIANAPVVLCRLYRSWQA